MPFTPIELSGNRYPLHGQIRKNNAREKVYGCGQNIWGKRKTKREFRPQTLEEVGGLQDLE